jgi:HSP20 family protein
MAIMRWDPYGEMMSLRQAMDRLLEESYIRPGRFWGSEETGGLDLDLMEQNDSVVVKASIPGVKPEDISITVENGVLTIKGETREEKQSGEGRYHRRERRVGRFARAISLPVEVNADACDAEFEHGVLTITLPKAEQARPKQIAIRGQATHGAQAIEGQKIESGQQRPQTTQASRR